MATRQKRQKPRTREKRAEKPEAVEQPERPALAGGAKTVALKEAFLEAFSVTGIVSYACQAVGCHRSTAYWWQAQDPEFKRRFDEEALPAAVDVLQLTAWTMAVNGDKRIRRQYDRNGDIVSEQEELVRWPQVLIHLLKVWDPKRHSERIVAEHVGKDGANIALDLQGILRIADEFTEAAKE